MAHLPISISELASITALALISALIVQWLKYLLPSWRWTPLCALGVALLLSILLALAAPGEGNLSARLIEALVRGFLASSVAVFGYENIINLLGGLGKGPRA